MMIGQLSYAKCQSYNGFTFILQAFSIWERLNGIAVSSFYSSPAERHSLGTVASYSYSPIWNRGSDSWHGRRAVKGY